MSKIVLLSTIYIGMPSANGICARNLVVELKKMGHNVDVICYKAKDKTVSDTDSIHEIVEKKQAKDGLVAKISRTFGRIPGLLTKDACKLLDQDLITSYYDELCAINNNHKVDAIVAMFFPLEGLQAAFLFKNKFPNVKTLVYELDSVGDGIANGWRQAYYNKMYERWLNNIYPKMDSIVVMESHKSYWESVFFKFKEKVHFADIPVLVHKEEKKDENRVKYSMIYSGIIEKQYRSPAYLLETLLCLKEKIDYSFAFYSKGDCEEEIELAAQKYSGIKRCGFVTPEELDKQISKSDFLVSIGNSFSRSVPSKIISYVSCGKPIIHFASQKEDICVEYLKNYPACLVVDQSRPAAVSAEMVYQFLKDNSGVIISFNEIRQFFLKNDPSYSSQLIQDSLGLID